MEENKEVTNEKLNYKLIKAAGKNIRNATSLIATSVVLNILFSLVVPIPGTKFTPPVGIEELPYILMYLNIILGIAVLYQFYKAGNNLESSVPNEMV